MGENLQHVSRAWQLGSEHPIKPRMPRSSSSGAIRMTAGGNAARSVPVRDAESATRAQLPFVHLRFFRPVVGARWVAANAAPVECTVHQASYPTETVQRTGTRRVSYRWHLSSHRLVLVRDVVRNAGSRSLAFETTPVCL